MHCICMKSGRVRSRVERLWVGSDRVQKVTRVHLCQTIMPPYLLKRRYAVPSFYKPQYSLPFSGVLCCTKWATYRGLNVSLKQYKQERTTEVLPVICSQSCGKKWKKIMENMYLKKLLRLHDCLQQNSCGTFFLTKKKRFAGVASV